MFEVEQPFADEVARHRLVPELQSEDIRHLCGEDGDGDAAREAHDDGVGDELDDRPQPEDAQHDEDDARHQCGGDEARLAILLDDAVDNDDERARRSAYLHLAATQ